VLLRTRARTHERVPGDDALFTEVGRAIVARCALGPAPARACSRPVYEDGQTYLDRKPGRGPNLVTLWHPWVTAASHALASDRTVELPPELREELHAVARWGVSQIEPGIGLLATAPAYKLAEYLYAMATLLPDAPREPRAAR
jgi:hypothetical protein